MGPEYRNTEKQKAPGSAGGRPFTPNEKRTLTIRAERIDPKHLIDGEPPKVEAEHKRTVRHSTHEARFFQLATGSGLPATIRIQLNHGDPADDEARLAAITEDLLTEPEAPGTAGGWSDGGGISPRSAGGL